MKKLILFLLIFSAIAFAQQQQRWKVSYGTTGTSIDTVGFGVPFWTFYVENQGTSNDTLYVWQVASPTAKDKCVLTAGRGEYFISSSPNYYIYLQSNGSVKRYVKIFY